jgi:hypothetical protein
MLRGKVLQREIHELLYHIADGIVGKYYGIVYLF